MNKIEGAKELIKTADSIYEEFLTRINRKNFELYDEDELKRKINQYATLYAQICEYYLKALILPNLANENYQVNSNEEMIYLANDRKGLKKYNHIFKRIINSSEFDENIKQKIETYLFDHLPHTELERNNLSKKFCSDIGFADMTKYGTTVSIGNFNKNTDQSINNLLDIISNESGLISDNSNAYQESRYAMISNYVADLNFLAIFCDAIRNSLNLKFKNCLKINGCNRHIFPDAETELEIVFENGNIQKMIYEEQDKTGYLLMLDNKGEILDSIGYIWDYDIIEHKSVSISTIYFVENGKRRRLIMDKNFGGYIFTNIDNETLGNNMSPPIVHKSTK